MLLNRNFLPLLLELGQLAQQSLKFQGWEAQIPKRVATQDRDITFASHPWLLALHCLPVLKHNISDLRSVCPQVITLNLPLQSYSTTSVSRGSNAITLPLHDWLIMDAILRAFYCFHLYSSEFMLPAPITLGFDGLAIPVFLKIMISWLPIQS